MSNSQFLIVHKFPVLSNILNEIKNILNFNVVIINDNNFDDKANENNLVIISGEKKFQSKFQLKIDNYPIRINKLTEIINIQFLKNKFNQQNNKVVGKYTINFNARTMNYNNKILSLTEKELKIINFLSSSNKNITINELQSNVWGHKSKLETHTVETHVYRLRKKVEKRFNDRLFIMSVKNGYKIQT